LSELTNRGTRRLGLSPLKRQQRLMESAHWMARKDMAAQGYFDPYGQQEACEMPDRLLAGFHYVGYHAIAEGGTIAMGWLSPDEVRWRGWMPDVIDMLSLTTARSASATARPSASSASRILGAGLLARVSTSIRLSSTTMRA